MKIIRAIIIDDEQHARESLQSLIGLYCPSIKIIAEAADIYSGKKIIEQLLPDLVFLDISIGEETGFELLEKINPINFHLIFTTAFSEFALKAFRVNALDYLLKPINPKQLEAAIEKINSTNQTNKTNQLQLQFAQLAESLQSKSPKKIAISNSDGISFLEINQIIHIHGSANYSTFYMENGETFMASKGLKHFETLLPDTFFYRCHQSHLVNLNFIKKINTKESNSIKFRNGIQVPIARSKKEKLMERLSMKTSS